MPHLETPETQSHWTEQYDVIWDSPGPSSAESMPCGGGDIGLNLWAEDGDVLFYLARSGTFDENNTMLKLGRVRLRLEPNPFAPGTLFRQALCLRDGSVRLHGDGGTVHLWVEVGRPVVHVEIVTDAPTTLRAAYESWRTADRPLNKEERFQCMSFLGTTPEQFPVITHKDTIEMGDAQVLWYHRNLDNDLVFDKEVTQQHLSTIREQLWNPQKGLTFGGLLRGSNLSGAGVSEGIYQETPFRAYTLASHSQATRHTLTVTLHTAQTETVADWKAGLSHVADAPVSAAEAWHDTSAWWEAFWDRSYIVLNPGSSPNDPVWRLGRNYQLFRYLLGCNAFGEYPSKFNGGCFTWDAPPHTPDFRQWGGGSFTAQNQRLVYWPMLKNGDFEMMRPQFEFYRRALPNAELRTRTYWGHAGANFTEQLENFGLPVGEIYETNWGGLGLGPRPGGEPGDLQNAWCEDVYDTVLEFCLMLLDVEQFTGTDISEYLPLMESCVTFFDEHYPADTADTLIIYPGSACETYKQATNAASTVAGLLAVLSRMLELPETYGTPKQRARWARMLDLVPPLPFRTMAGRTTLAPAESWERINNEELPQLYPVYPFGLYGLGKPDLEIARDTWRYGADTPQQKGNFGWKQDSIWCARLGLTAEARDLIAAKLADGQWRFSAFWGPVFDWQPDLNHGGSAMIALQEMLMQTDGRQITLLPAWPAEWDVDFKLYAPYQTVVEGEVRGGQVRDLRVTPPERQEDIIVGPALHT